MKLFIKDWTMKVNKVNMQYKLIKFILNAYPSENIK